MDKDLKTILKETMKARNIKTPAVALALQIPVDRIYAWYRDDTNPKGEDTGKIERWVADPNFKVASEETSNSANRREVTSSDTPENDFSPSQLYAMFMRVTEMQTGILKSIESKMAQETTQADIKDKVEEMEANLNNVWNGLFVAATRQAVDREGVLSALSKLMGKPSDHLLKEANKKAAEIFEASGVPDKMDAKSR